MSRYLYAVICAEDRCYWADPEIPDNQHPTLALARQDRRDHMAGGPRCSWCGTAQPYRIVRRPIPKWEEIK